MHTYRSWIYTQSSRHIHTYDDVSMQEPVAQCSDCSFFVTDGVLTRTPDCNAAACTGLLDLINKGITQLEPGVFAGLTSIRAM
jgi:hypothetical protein